MSLALSARHAPEIEWIGQFKGGEAACLEARAPFGRANQAPSSPGEIKICLVTRAKS